MSSGYWLGWVAVIAGVATLMVGAAWPIRWLGWAGVGLIAAGATIAAAA